MTMRSIRTGMAALALLAAATAGDAAAQSSASSYSYGTYNPVQAAINRDSMNAAIIKQATGSRHATATRRAAHRTTRRR